MWASHDAAGDMEKCEDALKNSRGCMNHVLHMIELPEIDGADEDGTFRHMRIQELVS